MAFEKGNKLGKGRPKGAKNKQTIAREEARKRAIEADATPLDVLTAGMQHHYQQWKTGKADDDLAAAVEYAAKAAPYVHPRLASTDNTHKHGVSDRVAELIRDASGRSGTFDQWRQSIEESEMAPEQPVHHNGQGGE